MRTEPLKISIIVPAYNAQAHLMRCATTVLNQRYANLELILVDDGSDDCTPEMCDLIASWDERVRVIHQANSGVSAARNAGMRASTGDWIHFVDADDWIEQDLYALIVPQIVHNNADIAYFGWVFNGKKPVFQAMNARDGVGDSYILMHDMLLQVGPAERNASYSNYIWNKMFRRDLVFHNGEPTLFDESISVAEDLIWLLDVVPQASKGVFDHRAYYHYMLNKASVTKAESRRVSSWLQSQEIHMAVLDWLKEQGYEDLYEVHRRSCENYFISTFKQTAKRKNYAAAGKMFDNIQKITDGGLSEKIVSDIAILQDVFPKYKKQKEDLSHKSVKYAIKTRKRAYKWYGKITALNK